MCNAFNKWQHNIEIMLNDEADEVIEKLFKTLLNRYQNIFEKLVKVSEFVFDYIHLLYFKINPSCGGSYIDSLDSIKTKKQNKKTIKFYE